MKKLFHTGLINLRGEAYFNLIIIIAPLLNLLSGISIDLYVPSLPSITDYFDTTAVLTKNTITATMIGFAIGCILFGAIIDIIGRRRTLLIGLFIFTLASFLCLLSPNIYVFIFLRLIQGLAASVVSIGSRALIVDNFSGHRFNVGLLYTSIAYGLGPVIGPFIGGILEYDFGWKSNFLVFGLVGFILVAICFLFVHESLKHPKRFNLKDMVLNYAAVFHSKLFMAGIIILVCAQLELMTYPTLGAFFVKNILHKTAVDFGNTALIISLGYLLGTVISRFLIKKYEFNKLINLGFIFIVAALGLQLCFSEFGLLNLWVLASPIFLMSLGNGLIFPNVFTRCLKIFPESVGVATAVMLSLLMLFSSLGIFLISQVNIAGLVDWFWILGCINLIQIIIFYGIFKRKAG